MSATQLYEALTRSLNERTITPDTLERLVDRVFVFTARHASLKHEVLVELERAVVRLAADESITQSPGYVYALALLSNYYERQELFVALTSLDFSTADDYRRAIADARRLKELDWHAGREATRHYTQKALAAGVLSAEQAARIRPAGFPYNPLRPGERLQRDASADVLPPLPHQH